jgi:hypothetical protein
MNIKQTLRCTFLLLASIEVSAGNFVTPIIFKAEATTSACIDLAWIPSEGGGAGFSGLHEFTLQNDSGQQPQGIGTETFHSACGLQADTPYRFQVCAFYESEESDNSECSEWSNAVRTKSPVPGEVPAPPLPAPEIDAPDRGDTWIGIHWKAGYKYDSYFVNTNENIAPGLPRNTRTIHHDSEGDWGYQKVEGLQPGHTYYFEVQGCTETWGGLGNDHCHAWSSVLEATTLPPPDPNLCISGFVWREASPEDLVCVVPEERDVNIPNDEQQHHLYAQRIFQPGSCPLTAPKSRKCYVTECVPPNLWRPTPGERTCVTPDRARVVAEDNAAAASRRIGP